VNVRRSVSVLHILGSGLNCGEECTGLKRVSKSALLSEDKALEFRSSLHDESSKAWALGMRVVCNSESGGRGRI